MNGVKLVWNAAETWPAVNGVCVCVCVCERERERERVCPFGLYTYNMFLENE